MTVCVLARDCTSFQCFEYIPLVIFKVELTYNVKNEKCIMDQGTVQSGSFLYSSTICREKMKFIYLLVSEILTVFVF